MIKCVKNEQEIFPLKCKAVSYTDPPYFSRAVKARSKQSSVRFLEGASGKSLSKKVLAFEHRPYTSRMFSFVITASLFLTESPNNSNGIV